MSPARRFGLADILHVLNALPVGVMMLSPQGRVLHMNKALGALTGFDPEHARGLPCRHVLRGRPCVAGCPLGCGAFGLSGGAAGLKSGWPGGSGTVLPDTWKSDGAGGFSLETDILTRKKRKMPVRLTHFSVPDGAGKELFRLDVLEDLTEMKVLEQRLHQSRGHGRLIGKSAAMERVANLIASVAPTSAPILISGETGTGKDILAETLHQASQRSREPFVRLSVSPLPEELLVADLFGQATPGLPDKPGRLQQAAGGTLYITEVADIPKGIQSRLISVLDEGAILPVGGSRPVAVDLRLITATNHSPGALVDQGLVTPELFHRLNVVHLQLPPLRERREDIDFLLQHFLDMFAARFKKEIRGFSAEARTLLAAHDYPGNVRELRNIVEYAAMVCAEPLIGVDSLPGHLGRSKDGDAFPAPSPPASNTKNGKPAAPAKGKSRERG